MQTQAQAAPRPRSRRRQKNNALRDFFGVLRTALLLLLIAILFLHYVGQRVRVEGSSMTNTLQDGDQLIMDKLTYRFSEPERFDIIVFTRSEDDKHYIKRIIALPGETIRIEDSEIYIDGALLADPYKKEPHYSAHQAAEPIVLGEDEYFVMGDNRNGSEDSRRNVIGIVKRDRIDGRAIFRIWPLPELGLLTKE